MPKNLNLPIGFEAYSVKELEERLPMIPKPKRKLLCIVKDQKPSFIRKSEWKQTYSFQEKSKVKSYGLSCVKKRRK